jgi:hypothetical protein
MSEKQFEGKSAIITGETRGIKKLEVSDIIQSFSKIQM